MHTLALQYFLMHCTHTSLQMHFNVAVKICTLHHTLAVMHCTDSRCDAQISTHSVATRCRGTTLAARWCDSCMWHQSLLGVYGLYVTHILGSLRNTHWVQKYAVASGWQKLREAAKGLSRIAWTQSKNLCKWWWLVDMMSAQFCFPFMVWHFNFSGNRTSVLPSLAISPLTVVLLQAGIKLWCFPKETWPPKPIFSWLTKDFFFLACSKALLLSSRYEVGVQKTGLWLFWSIYIESFLPPTPRVLGLVPWMISAYIHRHKIGLGCTTWRTYIESFPPTSSWPDSDLCIGGNQLLASMQWSAPLPQHHEHVKEQPQWQKICYSPSRRGNGTTSSSHVCTLRGASKVLHKMKNDTQHLQNQFLICRS